jgi:hypothetical protein
MKAEELRIGNYVYYNKIHKDIGKVSQIRKEILFSKEELIGLNYRIDVFYESKDIEPIILTNEWLLKFGFVKDKIDNTFYKDDFDILLPNFLRYKQAQIYKIKHVHELQNLYFAVTNKELITKN